MNLFDQILKNMVDYTKVPTERVAWLNGTDNVIKRHDGTYLLPEDFDENKVYFVVEMHDPKLIMSPIQWEFEEYNNMLQVTAEYRLWRRP